MQHENVKNVVSLGIMKYNMIALEHNTTHPQVAGQLYNNAATVVHNYSTYMFTLTDLADSPEQVVDFSQKNTVLLRVYILLDYFGF